MDNLNKSFPDTFFNDVEKAREEIKVYVEERLRKLHAMMPEKYNLGISLRFNTEPKFVNETYINVINSQKKNLLGAIQHEKADVVIEHEKADVVITDKGE